MRLQTIRQHKNLTQKQLAERSGVPLRAIQTYEAGYRNIDGAKVETLVNLAVALGVGVADLIEDEKLRKRVRATL